MKKLLLGFFVLAISFTGSANAFTGAYCSQQLNFCNESLGRAKLKLRTNPHQQDAIFLEAGKTPGCERWLCECGAFHDQYITEYNYTQQDITFFKGTLFIKQGANAYPLKQLVCGQ